MSSIKKTAFPTPLLNDRISLIAAQLESKNPPSTQTLMDDGESPENIQLAMQDVLYHRIRTKLCHNETLTSEEAAKEIIDKAAELQAKIEQFIACYEEEPDEEFAQKLEERIASFTPRLILKAKAFYEQMTLYQETALTPPTMLHQFDSEYNSQSSVQSESEDRNETPQFPFTLRLNFGNK